MQNAIDYYKRQFNLGSLSKEERDQFIKTHGLQNMSIADQEQYYKNNGKSLPLPLPPYINNIDSKHTRYWKESDIPKLIYFSENIPRGELADYNRLCWGDAGGIERGERVKARRIIQEMLNEGRFQNE